MTELVKKGFGSKEKEAIVLRFTPMYSFGKSNPPAFELSSDDEGQISQWYFFSFLFFFFLSSLVGNCRHSVLCQKMAGWSEI